MVDSYSRLCWTYQRA